MTHEEAVEGEVLPSPAEVEARILAGIRMPESEPVVVDEDPHALTTKPYPWGVAWTCACGRWEAVATGPSSAGFAERSYARHRAEEETAARGE